MYLGFYRCLNERHVADLQESIERIGLTTPIFVAPAVAGGFTLVAGQHRLEATRRLGQTHIDAIVLEPNGEHNRLLAISENLHRLSPSALERAEAQSEWVQAFQDEVGQLAQPLGGQQPNNKGVSKTSRELDVSRRELSRAQKIAGIAPEAKIKIRELALHDNQSALLKIAAGQTVDEQLALAADFVEHKKRRVLSAQEVAISIPPVSASSLPAIDWSTTGTTSEDYDITKSDHEVDFNKLVASWNASPDFQRVWSTAISAARVRFAADVLNVLTANQSEASHVG